MTANLPPFFLNAFYEAKFAGALFVVKASGDVVDDDAALASLMADMRALIFRGIRVLFVYGGGGPVDKALDKARVPVVKREGRRVTDAATLAVMQAELGGRLALKVHAAMAAARLDGLAFNAVPGGWMDVGLRPKTPHDFGLVGDIARAHGRAVHRVLRAAPFVACACLAATADGTAVNINADTVATDLAIAAGADKLLLLSNVDGVLVDGARAFTLTDADIPGLIERGVATGGMRVKLENCARALAGGVGRVHILSGLVSGALGREIFESVGPGTMVLKESERAAYLREVEVHKRIEGGAQHA
jgi:acetylglutamate kinase